MRELLSRPHLHELAVSLGFCQRASKLKPEIFFDLLFYTLSHTENASLSYMVSALKSNFGVNIKKQSLDERFNAGSVAFVKAVLSEVICGQFAHLYSSELLPDFARIRIKDSTKFMVPPALEAHYGSCGGDIHSRSRAGISIQYEYDLKSGKVTDLSITSGDRNDRTDAGETTENMEKDDLIIRDLGYFSTPVLKSCMEKKAFFLSRIDSSTNVYDHAGNQISFTAVYRRMQNMGKIEEEMSVHVGKQTRLPVRLILQLVPDEVYQKRIREKSVKSKGQGRGKLTVETKVRSRFTIFITNAEESQLSIRQIFPLYRLRWQIELQFKIWKSVFKIASLHDMKEARYITCLYIKLLMIMINLQITYSLQQAFTQCRKEKVRLISLNKAMKTLKTLFDEIFSMMRGTYRKAMEAAHCIQHRLSENHWLERKKKKMCFPEILEVIICISRK
jgi:hypothetical protein